MNLRVQHLRMSILPNLLRSGTLALHPRIRRENVGRQLLGLPIFAHWDSRIRIARGARLVFREGGFLKLGVDYSPMHPQRSAAVVDLRDEAVAILSGHVDFHRGCLLWGQRSACIEIGNDTFLSNGSRIIAEEEIRIGAGCSISWDVTLLDTDFHHAVRPGKEPRQSRPIRIEDGVWIGCGATILKGSRVGTRSIVAAGAIVSGEFPPHSLVAGVPARVVASDVDWY